MFGMIIALGLAQASAAATKPTGSTAQNAPTAVQQLFDKAAALDVSGTPEARAAAWHVLVERAHGNRRTVAIAQLREGIALATAGRMDEANGLVRAALVDLPAADPTLRIFRYDGTTLLAGIAEADFDYAAAAERYASAEPLAQTPSERLGALLGLIRTATYTDQAAALAAVGRADALLRSVTAEPAVSAMVRRYHAELLLNRSDYVGAKQEAATAVKLMGGLTTKTNSNDVSIRSDYAIAALLTGKPDEAREYLAMTGAGRLPGGVFGRGVDTNPPDCGGEAGLKPDDMAIVEFTVADDGHTVGVRPVYAAGGGAVALEFARAVGNWSWTPEQLKDVPIFFRNRVRLELRCSTSFQRPSVATYFDGKLASWLDEQDIETPAPPPGSDAAALPLERTMLVTAEKRDGADALALIPIMSLLTRNRVTPSEEVAIDAARALTILSAHKAPPAARLAIDLAAFGRSQGDHRKAMQALAVRYAGDPEAVGALALIEADGAGRDTNRARTILRPVAEDAQLSLDHPVRSAALVRLASLEQRASRPEAARAIYAEAKIAPESCALIDSPPHLLHAGGTFPMEAMRWGFEGWTLLQYDISPAGKVSNERAIIAYPPFVFTKAAIATMAGAQFAKTYRPDGQLGCGGNTGGVRFAMPQHAGNGG
ncbi:MAG: hypothetical protein ACRYFW_05780 [Janthinobacterium lividum]